MIQSFGAKVRLARERRGMTSEELARRTGLSQPFISQVENDQKFPSHKNTVKIAEVLDVPVMFFFSDTARIIPDESFPAADQQEAAKYVNYYEAIDEAVDAGISPEELKELLQVLKKHKK